MPAGPQCWTCRRGRVPCDGNTPACSRCTTFGLDCLGYGADTFEVTAMRGADADIYGAPRPKAYLKGGNSEHEDDGAQSGDSAVEYSPAFSPSGSIVSQPTPQLYRRAQMIIEGLDYFNQIICPDLVSSESHFNPYRVNLQRLDRIPEIYVNVLVSTAGLHRLMSAGPEPTPSSAIIQKDVDVFSLRVEALQGLNEQLSRPESQTSDATLLCVLSLMIASIQSSAYTEWRSHLEGARRIIQMRGGLKKVISGNPYFKPVLTFFILTDVISATTSPSNHKDMQVATNMALKYWEIEPGVFQFISTTAMPVPDELFQVIVLVNYLRTLLGNKRLLSRLRSGTKMVINKVLLFSPTDYANKMHGFNGWKTTGNAVDFSQTASPSQTASDSSGDGSAHSSPSTDTSRSSNVGEVWLSVAIMYRASVLLYALRTLVIDSDDNPSLLLPEGSNVNVENLRRETLDILASAVAPIFADPVSGHKLGKLTLWPMFILGMETDYHDTALRDFVTNGFALLSQAMGSMGPLGAIDELQSKWTMDEERGKENRVTWDEYFQGRADYIVF